MAGLVQFAQRGSEGRRVLREELRDGAQAGVVLGGHLAELARAQRLPLTQLDEGGHGPLKAAETTGPGVAVHGIGDAADRGQDEDGAHGHTRA